MPGEEEHRVGTSAALLANRQSNAPSTTTTTTITATTPATQAATTSKAAAAAAAAPTTSGHSGVVGPQPTYPLPPLPLAPTTSGVPKAGCSGGGLKSPPRKTTPEQIPSATPPPPPPPSLQVKPKIRLNSKSPESTTDEIEQIRHEPATLLAAHPKFPPHFRGIEDDDEDDEDEDDVLDSQLAPNADGEDSSVGSRLEMELQFAGVDIENAELDAEDEDNFPSGEIVSRRVGGLREGVPESSTAGEDKEAEKPKETPPAAPTFAQKVLFYITATFILLAIFSLFLFLFLVPFVIDPAFSTIFMEFDPEPALCITESVVNLTGQTNCTWTSCKEGCTREVFSCTQVRVNYWVHPSSPPLSGSGVRWDSSGSGESGSSAGSASVSNIIRPKFAGGTNYYNYQVGDSVGRIGSDIHKKKKHKGSGEQWSGSVRSGGQHQTSLATTVAPSESGRMFKNAHLFPNVKGCGYPPSLNCSVFYNQYAVKGRNFSCYYSKVNPGLVITVFDMDRVILELALAMAIPIPCFIISVIYLVFAYFRIYNKESPSSPTANNIPTSTNNNIASAGGGAGGGSLDPDAETSLSTTDEKTRIIQRSTSRGLNAVSALTDKLMPNSGKGLLAHAQVIEMNDLTPMIRTPADGDFILPSRNNRAPERNGPTNPAAKNKGY